METKIVLSETPESLKESERTMMADTLVGQRTAAPARLGGRGDLMRGEQSRWQRRPVITNARVSGRRCRFSPRKVRLAHERAPSRGQRRVRGDGQSSMWYLSARGTLLMTSLPS